LFVVYADALLERERGIIRGESFEIGKEERERGAADRGKVV